MSKPSFNNMPKANHRAVLHYFDSDALPHDQRTLAIAADGLAAARRARPLLDDIPEDLAVEIPDLLRILRDSIARRAIFVPAFREAAEQFRRIGARLLESRYPDDEHLREAVIMVGEALDASERVEDLVAAAALMKTVAAARAR
ncbi:hypothetical protein [Tranquillimonas alkanivorans]|uniref:Uncharacterized protein n=1 Tax=Tranquillimonas alkanivorans TaxID=441119 RepID=A0A1I5PCM9_9RHOB|nr:hypothetical protein [Tranquillimonas alkanivorans]SFP31271.1 hypothetical protein SAMN04488047_10510 [Tranquillimonas alkanivorans]